MSLFELEEIERAEKRQEERNRAFDGEILKRLAERSEEEAFDALVSLKLVACCLA